MERALNNQGREMVGSEGGLENSQGFRLGEALRGGIRWVRDRAGWVFRGMAVIGFLAAAEGEARGDIVEDFAVENQILAPEPINNASAVSVGLCSIEPNGEFIRAREILSISPVSRNVKRIGIEPQPDGEILTTTPAEVITTDPTQLYGRSVLTNSGNEFQQITGYLERDGETVIAASSWGLDGAHIDGENLIIGHDMGRERGFTYDSSDITQFDENYIGPPFPITSALDLREHVTIIPELSPDPPDQNEAYLQGGAVLSSNHAYVTMRCIRGLWECITTTDANTNDIYMFDYNPDLGTWDSASMTKVASTDTETEGSSCVLDHPSTECLFIGRGGQLWYACSPKDNDSDGVNNWTDNCRDIANPLQENSDDDTLGNSCDNCDDVSNPGQEDSNGNGIGDACEVVIPDAGADVMPDVSPDAGPPDAPPPDNVIPDAEEPDMFLPPPDAGADVMPDVSPDAGPPDAQRDAGIPDQSVPDEDPPSGDTMHIPSDGMPPEDSFPRTEMQPPPNPDGCSCSISDKPKDNFPLNLATLLALPFLARRIRIRRQKV